MVKSCCFGSKASCLALVFIAFQTLLSGDRVHAELESYLPLNIISPSEEPSLGEGAPCLDPAMCPELELMGDAEDGSSSEIAPSEGFDTLSNGPEKRRYEFMRLGKRNPDLEKRRYEFMRLGRSQPDKRRYEFMRLGKRRYEFMRLGKRRYEFMRLGKRGDK